MINDDDDDDDGGGDDDDDYKSQLLYIEDLKHNFSAEVKY